MNDPFMNNPINNNTNNTRKLLIPLGSNTTRNSNASDNKENTKANKSKVGSIKYSRCSIPSTKFAMDKRAFGKDITNIILNKDNLKCSLSQRSDSNNPTATLSKANSKDNIFPPSYNFNMSLGLKKDLSLKSLRGTASKNNIITNPNNNKNNGGVVHGNVLAISKEKMKEQFNLGAGMTNYNNNGMIKPKSLTNIHHCHNNSNDRNIALIPSINIVNEKAKGNKNNVTITAATVNNEAGNAGGSNNNEQKKVNPISMIPHNIKHKKPFQSLKNSLRTSISATPITTPPPLSSSITIPSDNPQLVNEYRGEIYINLLDEERNIQFPINSTYMSTQNKEINSQMRSILVDWLIEVHDKFKYSEESLFLTISILDRYLSLQQITRDKFQLVGVASLFIACKHEEIELPNPKEFVYITDKAFNEKDLYHMEYSILKALHFAIMLPTSLRFYEYLSVDFGLNKEQDCLGRYMLNCALIDYEMIRYNNSEIAFACLYMAMKHYDMNDYDKIINGECPESNKRYCNKTKESGDDEGKTSKRLNKCVNDVMKMFDKHSESSEYNAVRKKFLHKKYAKIALVYHKKRKEL